MIRLILTVLFLLLTQTFGQVTITGKVLDSNGLPLPGVNITYNNSTIGTSTDINGKFELKDIPEGPGTLRFSIIGYKTLTVKIKGSRKNLLVRMLKTELQLDEVLVSASKYKQKNVDLPVSAEVMDAQFISEKNIVQLDEALRYIPGVNVTLDQISIRGSSGYSRGAGTRVLTAVDGIPIYSGDTGEIIWQLIPVNDAARIEVIKGAASSIYGSSALGGVVNIITKKNASAPLTYVRTLLGAYDKPYYKEWDWSGERRLFNSVTISHSNTYKNLSYTFSLVRNENSGYRQNDWVKRFSGYSKISYRFKDESELSLLFMGLKQRRGTFNFWKDSRNALVPPDADQGQNVNSTRAITALTYSNYVNPDWFLKVTTSYYYNNWNDESESANNSNSGLLRTELQSVHNIGSNAKLTYGVELLQGKVESNIFGNPTSTGLGGYFQMEYKFKFPLRLTFGARYDVTGLDTLSSFKDFSPKVGLNYHINKLLILRASFGKGFRAPTLAEVFTSTTTSGISVKPNPELLPERSYSYEVGVKKIFPQTAELDFTVFQSDYTGMVEPTIDPADGKAIFKNVTRARIQGIELSNKFELPFIRSSLNFAYTYLWARDMNENKFLKYRPRHLIYAGITWSPSFYQAGIDFRYWSRVEEIDNELVDLGLVKDGDKRTEVFVMDLRAGASLYQLGVPLNLYLNINNLLNYNYVEMIGNVSPIRNISLNFELIF